MQNQATSSTFVGANTPSIQAGHSPSGPDRVCGNEPDQHDLSPPSNGKSSKQGLFAKYRAKRLSDASKSPRSSEDKENRMGNQAGSEYSPLGSQMRSLSLGQDERMQVRLSSAALAPSRIAFNTVHCAYISLLGPLTINSTSPLGHIL